LYLGSADIMQRNLDHRVETLFPVLDRDIIQLVKSDLELMLIDNTKSWEMQPDGSYRKVSCEGAEINSQNIFLNQSARRKFSKKFKAEES